MSGICPPGCEQATLWATEYEDIFLTQDTVAWDEMDDDLDISKYIKEWDDFIIWRLKERLGAQGDQLCQKMCKQEFLHPSGGVFHLKDNEFFKHNGDGSSISPVRPGPGPSGKMPLSVSRISP